MIQGLVTNDVQEWRPEVRTKPCGCAYVVEKGVTATGHAAGRCSALVTCAGHSLVPVGRGA